MLAELGVQKNDQHGRTPNLHFGAGRLDWSLYHSTPTTWRCGLMKDNLELLTECVESGMGPWTWRCESTLGRGRERAEANYKRANNCDGREVRCGRRANDSGQSRHHLLAKEKMFLLSAQRIVMCRSRRWKTDTWCGTTEPWQFVQKKKEGRHHRSEQCNDLGGTYNSTKCGKCSKRERARV